MMRAGRVIAAAAAMCVLLAACSQPAPPAKGSARPDTSTSVDARTLAIVASIRATGAQFDSSVEVKPLRDPAVDGLLDRARKLEAQQQITPAIEAVNKALAIAPNAPDILQYEAELRILVHDWKNAGELAQRSWDLGPKVGPLCARNVQTLVEVNQAQGDAAAAAKFRQQLSSCKVPVPPRY